ncbi:MAG: hypothetical protein K2X27_03530, partial [Candidatus Obscuribacterales bacterium]|nr:hypothetical protein [Candidatus Obscuribacterales bacterium]
MLKANGLYGKRSRTSNKVIYRKAITMACLASLSIMALPTNFLPAALAVDPPTTTTSTNASGTDLTVNAGSTLIIDFGQSNTLNLTGNLTNHGTIYAVSSNPQVTTANFSSANLYNTQGALLTSVIPNGGIPGWSGGALVSNFSINFFTTNNIVNNGTISSAGNLAMIAGGSITNTPAIQNAINPAITAMNSVNLQAANIMNAGLISSATSNVNIATAVQNALATIQNSGTIAALNGTIFMGSNQVSNLLVNGSGDFLAQSIQAVASKSVDMSTRTLQGLLSVYGQTANISTNTSNLVLNNISVTGDPVIYNAGGDISIAGTIACPGNSLSIIAAGDIKTINSGLTISTSSTTSSGGDIVILAGSSYVGGVLSGASATGGSIDFSTNSIQALTSAGLAPNSNGGNITLAAYKGSNASSGNILLPMSGAGAFGIFSGGSGTGNNGNVSLIAGADTGISIVSAPINASGGSGSGGNIHIVTAQPVVTGAGTFNADGSLNGAISWTTAQQQATAVLNTVNAAGSFTAAAGNIILASGKSLIMTAPGGSTGSVALLAAGTIQGMSGSSIQVDGGNVLLVSGANFSNDANNNKITISGAGAGGDINFGAADFIGTTATNGNGGQIQLMAFSGGAGGGHVTTPLASGNSLGLFSSGSGNNLNGDISFIGSASDSTAVTSGQINAGAATGGGGNVSIKTASIQVGAGVDLQNAAITAGSFSAGARTSGKATVGQVNRAGSLTVDAGNVALNGNIELYNNNAANNINITSATDINSTGAIGIQTLGGQVKMLAGDSATGGSVDLSSAKFISTANPQTGMGGNKIEITANSGSSAASGHITAPSLISGGADISLLAGHNIGINGSSWTLNNQLVAMPVVQTNGGKLTIVAGNSATGGLVNLSATQYVSTASATGAGGDILITATEGSDSNSAHVYATSLYSRTETSNQANGNVTIDGAKGVSVSGLISASSNKSALEGRVSVSADKGTVQLGSVNSANCLTVTAGNNINFNGTIAVNGVRPATDVLTMVAGGNITGTGLIQTAGGDTLLAAGANYNKVGNNININGASAGGGNIALGGLSFLSTAFVTPGSPNGNGGNITALAYADGLGANGTIALPSIWSGGAGTGSNGNITLIAGGASGTTISTGDVSTGGGSGGGGNLFIATAQPGSGTIQCCTSNGSFGTAGPVQQNATAAFGNICCAGEVTANVGHFTSGNITSLGDFNLVTTSYGGNLNVLGNINISSASDLQIDSGSTFIASKNVNLTAADTLRLGSNNSGQNPITLSAGTLTAQGVTDVTNLFNGSYSKNYLP